MVYKSAEGICNALVEQEEMSDKDKWLLTLTNTWPTGILEMREKEDELWEAWEEGNTTA